MADAASDQAPPPPPGLDQAQAWQPSAAAAAYPYSQPPPHQGAYAPQGAYTHGYYQSPPALPPPPGPPPGADAGAPQAPPPGPAGGYDYSQYYAGYHQQPYAHYPPSYPGYPPPSAHPPPQAWQQPPPSTSAPHAPPHQSTYQSYTGSYNAVPPPASLTNPPMQRRAPPPGLVIRPNANRAWGPSHTSHNTNNNSMVSVAQAAAAAAISSGMAPAAAQRAPAYIQVGGATGGHQPASTKNQPLNPQSWPPAVKAYVERAFKATPASQRTKLQEALRAIIGDAQDKGELWTRRWDTLPLPDVSMRAADAAILVSEVAAVSAVGGQGAGQVAWARPQPQPAPRHPPHTTQQRTQKSAVGMVRESPVRGRDARVVTGKKRSWAGVTSKTNAYGESDSDSDDASQGGPYSVDEANRRRRRAGRFKDGTADGVPSGRSKEAHAEARRARLTALLDDVGDGEDVDWNAFAIKGTCSELEKSYFRLTSAPDPCTVRPEAVLRRALSRLVRLIASGEVNYFYAQDQFKGMRQDCVVQALQGPLAVEVYEAHARAALEYGDVAEYNQCQGQVGALYAEGSNVSHGSQAEFLAYRLLYQAVHARHGEALPLLHTLRKIGDTEAALPGVEHALKVRAALASEDYPRFFRLYTSAPALGRALMDLAVPRLRFAALSAFVKAFKPALPVDFLARVLGFVHPMKEHAKFPQESARGAPLPGCKQAVFVGSYAGSADVESGRKECLAWLSECGAVIVGDGSEASIDCKASTGQLKVPEEKGAVAHGDANLDIGDFLKGFEAS